MSEIRCRDTLGRDLNYLTQWDVNRIAIIEGIELSPNPRVRFGNKVSKVSLVVKPTIENSAIRVDIPNILLQQPHPITISVFYERDGDLLQVEHVFTIPVVPQTIPEDYFFVNNIEYTNWVEVKRQAEILIEALQNDPGRGVLVITDAEPDGIGLLWFDTNDVRDINEV